MSKDAILNQLKCWKMTWENNNKVSEDLYKYLGLTTESPVLAALWVNFDSYTSTLGLVLSSSDWLEWYCWENAMGEAKREAGYDKKVKPICNLEDLADLILEGRGR